MKKFFEKKKQEEVKRTKEAIQKEQQELMLALGDRNYLKAKIEADIVSINKKLWANEVEIRSMDGEKTSG